MRIAFLILILVFVFSACQQSYKPEESGDDIVLAEVGDVTITKQTIQDELDLIPPYQRATFETPEGQRVLLDHLIERELLLQAARDAGLEEDSFVVAQVEMAMQQVEATKARALITAFYEKEVVEGVEIPEEEILEYYNDHIEDIYHMDRQANVSHILVGEETEVSEVLERIEDGEPFDSVAIEMSAHLATAGYGGELGWITIGAPIPYLGNQPEISRTIFEADTGEIIGPLETEMGYHIFSISEMAEEGTKPLEEVRESIINILRPGRVNTYYRDTILPSLEQKYGVEINEEAFLPDVSISADSLLVVAQSLMEQNPERAITHFQLFLRRYPEDEKAFQAQFLIGFTYSEYLRDYDSAREAFRLMIEKFPDSELTDDAEWMLDNMETPIEEIIPVEPDAGLSETVSEDETVTEE